MTLTLGKGVRLTYLARLGLAFPPDVLRATAAVLVSLTDVRNAIGFSSFCVLTYYAIANAAAWTLPPERRRWPRGFAGAGVVGCVTLACTLPARTALSGGCVLAAGAVIWATQHRSR